MNITTREMRKDEQSHQILHIDKVFREELEETES